jgi:error-prone DNA polymerase
MTHLRDALRRRGLLSAAALRDAPNGRWVRTAGHVIVRQRPGSAKGMCFLTLEDETGTANAVLTPQQFRRFRVPLHTSPLVEIAGPVQNVDGVVHVRVKRLAALALSVQAPPAKAWDAFDPDVAGPAGTGSRWRTRAGRPVLPDSHDYH